MKSTAHLKGHPLHTILVPFPIAFLTGTVIFGWLGYINQNPDYWKTAGYLEIAGLISGLIAALPGLVDFLRTVPPRSSAKDRAAKHALLNLSMLLLFFMAALKRDTLFSTWVVLFESAGFVLMMMAGWMGGTLVVRNQIGVNPRYAEAGKWKEKRLSIQNGRIEAATIDELKTDQMMLLHIQGHRIVLARTETGYVAFDDRCSHRGGSLAGGAMICGTVQCPWHGSQFDVKTGQVKAGPGTESIKTFPVIEQNGKVYLEAAALS